MGSSACEIRPNAPDVMFMETAAQVVVIDASGKQTLVVCSIFHWSNVTG